MTVFSGAGRHGVRPLRERFDRPVYWPVRGVLGGSVDRRGRVW